MGNRVTVGQVDRLNREIEQAEQLRDEIIEERAGGDFDQFARYLPQQGESWGEAWRRFCQEVLAWTPFDAQVSMADQALANPQTLIYSANSFGKDAAFARVALYLVYVLRFDLAVLTGHSERQVRLALMKECRGAWLSAPLLFGQLFAMELRIGGEPRIIAFVAADGERLVGIRAPRMAIIMTEAQAIPADVYEAAFANVSSAKSKFIIYGNPTQRASMFFELSRRHDFAVLGLSALSHPNVTSGQEVIPGAVTRHQVETIRNVFGESSPQFQARVLGIWPNVSEYALVQPELIDTAIERGRLVDPVDLYGTDVRMGLDVAGPGDDLNSLAIIHGGYLRPHRVVRPDNVLDAVRAGFSPVWAEPDVLKTASLAWGCMEIIARGPLGSPYRDNRPQLSVDMAGIGLGTYLKLKEFGHFGIYGFNSAQAATSADQFMNARAEAGWRVREALQSAELGFLPNPETGAVGRTLREEIEGTEYIEDRRGRIGLPPKDDIRRLLKRSPDRFDSLMIANYKTGPGVARGFSFRPV